DSRGKFSVYLNAGSKTNPLLQSEQPLYHKGMNVFGSWRVRPGVGIMGNRMVFIHMDKDDEFHSYSQIDEYNIEDLGKLTIGDSMAIRGARLPAGAVGRSRIEIVDWDLDGIKDLLVGTYGK